MNAEYHVRVTREATGLEFSPEALEVVIAANLAMDSGWNQLRFERHFDNDLFAQGWTFVESEHARIQSAAREGGTGPAMQAAFGRLCHAVQDFYSHSNYVQLWLDEHGGFDHVNPDDIDPLDGALLRHPQLRSGHFKLWRDLPFHFKQTRGLMRRLWVPAGSHEAMNLDHPGRGPLFPYSLAAACKRTRSEFERVRRDLSRPSLARFLGRN